MKRLAPFFLLIFVLSCGSKKSRHALTISELTSECPKTGTCSVKLLPNQSMLVTQDENRIRYVLEENPTKNVIIFTYSKTVKGDLQDASYREEIVFETDRSIAYLKLSDVELQSAKMLFGRFCYCKGQTGYYKVVKGKLFAGSDHLLSLQFDISEVPQIIKQIQVSLK